MKEIYLYVEGGGEGGESKAAIRKGFSRFFQALHDLARPRNVALRVVASGSRQKAFKSFRTGARSHPEAVNLLLVDSEEAVTASTPREHLRNRQGDGWKIDAPDDHCHLMVQIVESWLVSDPDALERFYGKDFARNALPKAVDIEAVDKADILTALEQASQRTTKGRYQKIKHCAELLPLLDPSTVRKRAKHCDRLFSTLKEMIEAP